MRRGTHHPHWSSRNTHLWIHYRLPHSDPYGCSPLSSTPECDRGVLANRDCIKYDATSHRKGSIFSYKTGLSSERSRDRRESSSYFSYDNYTSLLDECTVSFPSLRDGSIPSVPASFFYGITLHSSFQYRWLRRSSFFVLGHCESRFFIRFLRNEKEKKKGTGSMNEEKRKMWGQGESNTQPFDLESNALPLRHALLVLDLPFTHISHWCECGLWTYWLGKDEFMNCRMQ